MNIQKWINGYNNVNSNSPSQDNPSKNIDSKDKVVKELKELKMHLHEIDFKASM